MSILKSNAFLGLIGGLALPPLVTRFFLKPYIIDSKYQEIDMIKHDLDILGWQIRNLEEFKGFKQEDVYVPITYFQGRY